MTDRGHWHRLRLCAQDVRQSVYHEPIQGRLTLRGNDAFASQEMLREAERYCHEMRFETRMHQNAFADDLSLLFFGLFSLRLIDTVNRYCKFLTDRTATQYDRLLAAACCPSVCPSVCNAVHCGSQSRCTALKVPT